MKVNESIAPLSLVDNPIVSDFWSSSIYIHMYIIYSPNLKKVLSKFDETIAVIFSWYARYVKT